MSYVTLALFFNTPIRFKHKNLLERLFLKHLLYIHLLSTAYLEPGCRGGEGDANISLSPAAASSSSGGILPSHPRNIISSKSWVCPRVSSCLDISKTPLLSLLVYFFPIHPKLMLTPKYRHIFSYTLA